MAEDGQAAADQAQTQAEKKHEGSFEEHELRAIEQTGAMSPPAIFESIRRSGIEELMRPASALVMSALIAGIAIGFSVFTEGLLRAHLPETDWRPLIENFGYTVGFVIVIMGQMQLFTENTITAVCPALDEPCADVFKRLARLWGIVFLFNLIGAMLFGSVMYLTRGYDPALWQAVLDLSEEATHFPWMETMLRGIGAGWLIAALVWMLPNARQSKLLMIVLVTWIIATAEFTHVVAGSTEATIVILAGKMGIVEALSGFTLPTLIGNVLGGSVFFTVLTWAQIKTELEEPKDCPWRQDQNAPRRRA
ncbi:formate/nitrite transporter family protein [Thioclava sp. GXIMD4216]|uniref:formate/nitrite transporter family protein n=1 Tax=Thioclava sp. GXIMD4216 TaxID=3131929 RepID=UPI0030CF8E9C